MAIDIQGNKSGGGVTTLNFSRDSKAFTDAEVNSSAHYASLEGKAFSVVSNDATAAAGTYILYFKNTSTTDDFFVDVMRVGAVETTFWKIWEVTGTAAAGSALTPKNFNLSKGISASAIVRGNDSITGLTAVGAHLAQVRTAPNTDRDIPFDDVLILGTNSAVAVEVDTDDGTPSIAGVFIRGYYRTRL